ncbi:hypothetical protein A33Q_0315 [Indibacter alkaliphilus LW1]|uniref:Uncharacterized protein n=1 Tax=Indibacter alkaliphilus (strain CCUG 57479 / KCTC 22604 / LW1) TaxID=1189612 RepID=S2DKN2_INDAL|nr:hypothetical protein A33Q_0315 [Indibacter alkaliphilus LW1]
MVQLGLIWNIVKNQQIPPSFFTSGIFIFSILIRSMKTHKLCIKEQI